MRSIEEFHKNLERLEKLLWNPVSINLFLFTFFLYSNVFNFDI